MSTQKTLENKVAFIQGGSRGIGAAIAVRLAKEGAAVALTYVSSAAGALDVVREIEAAGGRAIAIQADSRDEQAIRGAISHTLDTFGRLDILVNNAGVLAVAPIDEFSIEDLDRTLDVNVRSVVIASQEAARRMSEGGAHHHHRQHQRRAYAVRRWFGLCAEQGCSGRVHQGPGA